MANQFLDAKEYANVFLKLLKNNLVMGRLVSNEHRSEVTDKNGLSINVKRPPMFVPNDGPMLQRQRLLVGEENVKVDQYKNVHFSVGDLEGARSWNDLMKNETLASAASTLAHEVDRFLADKMKEFNNEVGDAGAVINSFTEFAPVHTRLMENSVPGTNLNSVLAYSDSEKIRAALTATDISARNRQALETSRIPMLSDIETFASQNLVSVTNGTRNATGTVDGAGQISNYTAVKDSSVRQTLSLSGLGAGGTVSRGEVFTIAGVFDINPRTREVYDRLKQFVVTADATADGAGDVDVTIYPAIIVPGTSDGTDTIANTAFATVSAAPADAAVVTWNGVAEATRQVRAAFHRSAIRLVTAPLRRAEGVTNSVVTDEQTGISIRYIRDFDSTLGDHIHRFDMIYGGANMDPRLGSRVNGLTP